MRYRNGIILASAFAAVASAGIRPLFILSQCAWDATEVIELAVNPGEAQFRIVASIKGTIKPGAVTSLSLLLPPPNEHALLKDLSAHCEFFDFVGCREDPPPMRANDRLIVFLRAGARPAGMTMLTSAVWLQDGKAYAFEQTFNPGPSHLEEFHPPSQHFEMGNGLVTFDPGPTEGMLRSDIAQLLRWRDSYDEAVSNRNTSERVAELVRLAASKDRVVVPAALAKLSSEGPEAAHALRSSLDDDGLLREHFQILDTIAALKVRDIRFDSIIKHEEAYWTQMCDRDLGNYWTSNYGEPAAYHYLRLVSALKAIHALGVDEDLPAVRELAKLVDHCKNLKDERELRDVIGLLLVK